MDTIDYDSLSNPITDISINNAIQDDYVDYQSSDELPNDDNLLDHDVPELVHHSLQEKEEDHGQNDGGDDAEFTNVDDVIEELKGICDAEGVPCTTPMINLVRAKFNSEVIFQSSLVWLVRGVSLANQTQVLPTVMGAISDMKVETKILQQASSKMNKEVERAEKMVVNITDQLVKVKEDMQQSFRESIQLFLQGESEKIKLSFKQPPEPKQEKIKDAIAKDPKRGKDKVGDEEGTPNSINIPQPEQKPSTSKFHTVIASKRAMLLKLGFKPNWMDSLGDELIDVIYSDDIHSEVSKMKLTASSKKILADEIMGRVNEILDS